jgi:hypothetical protein
VKRHVCTGCCHAFRTAGGLKRHQGRTQAGPHAEPPRRFTTRAERRTARNERGQDRARAHMARTDRPGLAPPVRAPSAPAPRVPVRAPVPRARLPRVRAGRLGR